MIRKLLTLVLAVLMAVNLVLPAMAEETPSWMPEWDMDADVVVVGFGPARWLPSPPWKTAPA